MKSHNSVTDSAPHSAYLWYTVLDSNPEREKLANPGAEKKGKIAVMVRNDKWDQ